MMKKLLLFLLSGTLAFGDGMVRVFDPVDGTRKQVLLTGVPSMAQFIAKTAGLEWAGDTLTIGNLTVTNTLILPSPLYTSGTWYVGDLVASNSITVGGTNIVTAYQAADATKADGINLTEISTTNITKMFVVEFPQQSNGKSQVGVMPSYPSEFYTTGIGGTYVSTFTSNTTGNVEYSGLLKINGLETTAEAGSYLSIKDLFNLTNFYFARSMLGGASLTNFAQGTQLYNKMLERVADVKSNAASAGVPDAVIWGQGESGTIPNTEAAYYAQATNLIANLRADLSNATLKIIFTGFSNGSSPTNTHIVDMAKKRICAEDENCMFLEARAWETGPDGVHYSALGQMSRGRSSGNAVAGMSRGLKLEEGFRTDEAYVGRFGANIMSAGNVKAGNATIDGRLKAGFIDDGTKVIDPWNISLYLPFSSKTGVVSDPISGMVATNYGAAGISFDTNRLQGVYNPSTYATGTNYVQLGDRYYASSNMVFAFWIMNTNITTIGTIIGQSTGTYTNLGLTAAAAGTSFILKLRESTASGGSTCYWAAYAARAWDDGMWHRIYFAVSGTNMMLAVDGIAQGSAQVFSGTLSDVSLEDCYFDKIGYGYASSGAIAGNDSYIDEFLYMTNTEGTIQSALSDYNFQIKGDSGIRGYR